MNDEQLCNPIWWSIRRFHAHLAIDGGAAVRYLDEVSPWSALRAFDDESWAALAAITPPEVHVSMFAEEVGPVPPSFIRRDADVGVQMVFRGTVESLADPVTDGPAGVEFRRLTVGDVDPMLGLHALARPGPFRRRTIELGRYFGAIADGRLVAMAGERMRLDGHTEISAVSTHPDATGRGLGTAMTSLVARAILDDGRVPFLHCAAGNDRALHLYERLGFEIVRRVEYAGLVRTAD